MCNIVTVYPWLFAGLIAAFLPIGVELIQGQDSIILLFLLAGAMLAIERNREILAGALIAVGLFKFTVIVPIAFELSTRICRDPHFRLLSEER
jgi:uncharacterized membrane protein